MTVSLSPGLIRSSIRVAHYVQSPDDHFSVQPTVDDTDSSPALFGQLFDVEAFQ
jgi:hypothetical protein